MNVYNFLSKKFLVCCDCNSFKVMSLIIVTGISLKCTRTLCLASQVACLSIDTEGSSVIAGKHKNDVTFVDNFFLKFFHESMNKVLKFDYVFYIQLVYKSHAIEDNVISCCLLLKSARSGGKAPS